MQRARCASCDMGIKGSRLLVNRLEPKGLSHVPGLLLTS